MFVVMFEDISPEPGGIGHDVNIAGDGVGEDGRDVDFLC